MEYIFESNDKFMDNFASFKMAKPKICDFLEATRDGSKMSISMDGDFKMDNSTMQFIVNLVAILGRFVRKDGDGREEKLTMEDIERLDSDFFYSVYIYVQTGISPQDLLNSQEPTPMDPKQAEPVSEG